MNTITKIILSLMIIMIPVYSEAFFDVGAYGGYAAGTWEQTEPVSFSDDVKGQQYGASTHLTMGLGSLYLGWGLFYHVSLFTAESGSGDYNVSVNSIGTEAILSLGFPMVPVSPFLRIGISFRDSFKGSSETVNRYLSSILGAVGISYKIVPLVSIFAEYTYIQFNKLHNPQFTVNNQGVNLGLRLNL